MIGIVASQRSSIGKLHESPTGTSSLRDSRCIIFLLTVSQPFYHKFKWKQCTLRLYTFSPQKRILRDCNTKAFDFPSKYSNLLHITLLPIKVFLEILLLCVNLHDISKIVSQAYWLWWLMFWSVLRVCSCRHYYGVAFGLARFDPRGFGVIYEDGTHRHLSIILQATEKSISETKRETKVISLPAFNDSDMKYCHVNPLKETSENSGIVKLYGDFFFFLVGKWKVLPPVQKKIPLTQNVWDWDLRC